MVISKSFIELAKLNTIKNISIGYDEIYLFDVENIEKEQVGYSIDRDGKSLASNGAGSWKSNWLVFGFSENTGDPFFVDTAAKNFPVYTSMHGEVLWNPTMIADTYVNFIGILKQLQKLSVGRESPVALEANPIPVEEVERLISDIESKNFKSEVWYWENLFEQ